jgi:hypothetical protein
MTITSAIKGLITKGRKTGRFAPKLVSDLRAEYIAAGMPREQAKHAARKFLRGQ